jgi:hypothetical protein
MGNGLAERAEAVAHPLPDRFQRLEACAAPGSMDADALGGAMIDGNEDGDLTLAGPARGHVGAPHGIHPIRGNRAIMVGRPPG